MERQKIENSEDALLYIAPITSIHDLLPSMHFVDNHYFAAPHEVKLTITACCGTYHVCSSHMETIYDLKAFLSPHANHPYRAYPDEQNYYSMHYECVLEDGTELGILVENAKLLLGLADPLPTPYYIPQRSLVILSEDTAYERILSIHRELHIQYLPFLADWLRHDRLLSRIIIDTDHPQINWILAKITDAIASYPPCLRQIIFSVTEVSHLQWESLNTLYRKTTIPLFLEARTMKNSQELIYMGQTERELEKGKGKGTRPVKPQGLILLQPALLMKENPTERDMAKQEHMMSYDDPNLGEFPVRLYPH